jgi:putative peptidoglycan lipid II flippase
MSTKRGLLAAVGVVSVITLAGQLLNLAQEVVIAALFGTSAVTDAYKMALVIPTLIGLELAAIIGGVVIPVLHEQRKAFDLSEIFSVGFNFVAITALLFAAVIAALSPLLMDIIAGGFAEGTRDLSASLLRLLSAGMFFTLVSLFLSNVLNAFRRFALPALQRGFLYGGVLLGLILLHVMYGIKAAALGYVVGAGMFAAAQLATLVRTHVHYSPAFSWTHPVVKKMLLLASPLILYSALNQINVLIEKRIVSGLGTGSLSALDFAFKLSSFLINFLVIGANTVIFPTLSESFADEDHERINRLFHTLMKGLAAVVLPATVVFIVLGYPIVQLVFERGSFNAQSTFLTSRALVFYALGLFGQACVSSLPRFFQAFKRNDLLLKIGGIVIAFNVVAMLLLSHFFGYLGIAVAASATALLHSTILLSKMRTYIAVDRNALLQSILRTSLAALALGGALIVGSEWLQAVFPTTGTIAKLVNLLAPLFFGGAIYFAACWVLKVEVVMNFLSRIWKAKSHQAGAA